MDFKDRVLYIRKGKGKRQRVVPLGKNAVNYLKEYLEKIRPWYAKNNPKERKLFLNQSGLPMTPANIYTNLRKYRDCTGIKKSASAHTFRRSCATHLLQNGADIRYIQKLLGHRHLKTTQAYTKVMPLEVKQTHANLVLSALVWRVCPSYRSCTTLDKVFNYICDHCCSTSSYFLI